MKPAARSPKQNVTKATAKQRMLKQLLCTDAPEQALRYHGFQTIAGVDEVGRGALFGPVVAAAVILPERIAGLARAGLKDSKQLTREQREKLDRRIRKTALAVSVAEIDAETIDRVNIYQATRLAMTAAVLKLVLEPDHLLIDAMRLDLGQGRGGEGRTCTQTSIIYGDSLSISIAAASVVAKVYRDGKMRELHEQYPQYGLASHKGYSTPEHLAALDKHGPSPLHRKTFRPVAQASLPWDDLYRGFEIPAAAEALSEDILAAQAIENAIIDEAIVDEAVSGEPLETLLDEPLESGMILDEAVQKLIEDTVEADSFS